MNKVIFILFLNLICSFPALYAGKAGKVVGNGYVVVTGKSVMADPEWCGVVKRLEKKHQAVLIQYEVSPEEVLKELQKICPRYVAFVEKPEHIGPDYVIGINRLSCRVDGDVYADFLWGIITGYDARNAMEMVENAARPLVVRNVFSTSSFRDTLTVNSFGRYAWMDDYNRGMWGQKQLDRGITWRGLEPSGPGWLDSASGLTVSAVVPADFFDRFIQLYRETEPDWVLTGAFLDRPRWNADTFTPADLQPVSQSTVFQFPLPFGPTALMTAREGRIWADYPDGARLLPEKKSPKVYVAAGDNFGGNVANTRESLPVAWMNGGHAAAVIGYVTPNWYGVGGYGVVKHWVASAGRYTLPEAAFLNRQDIIARLNRWNPQLAGMNFPYGQIGEPVDIISAATGTGIPTRELVGYLYDRDAVAYYGDPKWDVRLQENTAGKGFTIKMETGEKSCTVTVATLPGFNINQMIGGGYKPEYTRNLPFSFIFPERLPNARLAPGQTWDAVADENFILIYMPGFEANKEYRIVIDFDGKTKKG